MHDVVRPEPVTSPEPAVSSPIVAASATAVGAAPATTAAPAITAEPPSAAAPPAGAPRSAYPAPAEIPTQEGPRGIRFDFNLGARVVVPPGNWRVRLSDLDSGNILFETETKGAFINSAKRWFVRFRIEAWEDGNSVFVHEYSAANREVLIQFPIGT